MKNNISRNIILKPVCDRHIVATGPKLIVDIPSGPMYQKIKKKFEKVIIHGFLANVFFSMGNPSNKKKSTVKFFFFPNSMKSGGNTFYGSRMIHKKFENF